jgi:hypothetical protein
VGPEAAPDVQAAQAQLERTGPSAYTGVQVDPRYKAEQLSQMEALKELRDKGGLNLTDRANLQEIQNQESSQAQAQRAAIMQNAQMRGVGGGNTAILDMLTANQGSANRQSNRDMQVAGMAQDRALNAGNSAAGLAGSMSNQDFNQQAQVAAARDTAARFNAQMSNANSQYNAGVQMQAALANMQKNQGVNNASANARNDTQTMNQYTMPSQQFGQQATRAAGLANAGRQTSDYYQGQQAAAQKAQGGLWGGALELGMKGLSKLGGGSGATGAAGDAGAGGAGGASTSATGVGSSGAAAAGPMMAGTAGMGYGAASELGYAQKGEDSGNADFSSRGAGPSVQGYQWWASQGGVVPGRSQVPGDSQANDIVDSRLSPGEVVVPRSVSESSPEEIAEYVKQAKIQALTSMRG